MGWIVEWSRRKTGAKSHITCNDDCQNLGFGYECSGELFRILSRRGPRSDLYLKRFMDCIAKEEGWKQEALQKIVQVKEGGGLE